MPKIRTALMNEHEDFLLRLYVPTSRRQRYDELWEFIDCHSLRWINPLLDRHRACEKLLLIETKGKSNRMTFDDWRIVNADFDSIGYKYALAYLHGENGYSSVKRLDITSPKNLIIQ